MKQNSCSTSTDRSLNKGQPVLEFVTITVPAPLGGIGADVPVKFKTPHLFFFICSITSAVADSFVALHFTPQNFNSGGLTTINPTGGEQWIPFSNRSVSNGRCEGRWIKFNEPVQNFFITADHPSANPASGNYQITMLGTDDIEAVISERL